MKEDFYKAKDIITNRIDHRQEFTEYDRIYPYTTENISGYMEDVTDKDVLTVVGSGDHYLNLILKGANTVDCFDINKFALYYLRLKKAAVKSLNKRDFFEFLTNNSRKHFDKVKPLLDANSYVFWSNYVNSFGSVGGIQSTFLFFPRVAGGDYIDRNFYLTNEGYELLQERIKDKYESYYLGDIYDIFDGLDKKYDSIYLSNICNYQENLKRYRDLILKLRDNNLTDNGEIYYAYFYGRKDADIHYYVNEIDDTEVIKFEGIDHDRDDKVLKLTKRTH
ncbi:MAG: DUF3419 family protein [Bacilli bacterium]|nr:DUF3419 family protein [Bacilli bacterium]